MIDELSRLLAVNGYFPHGYCINWSPTLLWTFVISDILIFISYFSMPIAIAYFAQRRKDFPYRWLLWLFAVFIMACGATHLMGAIVVWQPMYGLDALLKAVTAAVSVITAIALWPLLPHALKLPSTDQLRRTNEALQGEIVLRKRAEEALLEAKAVVETSLQKEQLLMAAIVENSSDAIFAKDHAGRYLLANRAVERIVGKTATLMTGQDDTFLFPQQAATIRANDHLVMDENRTNTFEETLATAEGERTFLSTKGPLHDEQGQVIGMFGISRDITERKQAGRQLGESEARFEVAMQASQDGLWEWNILTGEVYFTPRWYEILGYSREDQSLPAPTFKLWEERIHPDDHERVMSVLVSHLEKRTLYSVEYRHRHRSGEYRWQHARGLAIFDENGKPTKMVGTISDITERKQANQALQKSEESYRTLFREMQNGFAHSEIICDAQGRPVDSRYLAVNPAFERITGLKADAVVGKTLLEVFPALESGWLETFGRVALTGESANFEMYAAELGITFDVSAYRPASNQYACTFSDITERKHAEALLAEQLDELRRWQQAMIGREDRIITVKQEVNELLARSGQPPRYAPQLPAEPGEVDA